MRRTRSRRLASPEPVADPRQENVEHGQVPQASGELRRLRLDLIDVPRQRIRRDMGAVNDLAYSLGTVGILQPIQVFAVGERYRLIAGERRLRAAGVLGWKEIDGLVREPRGDELLLELVENAQRKFLTDAEEADAFIRLVRTDGHQITEVGAQAGRSEAYVSKRIRVFEDPVLRDAIERQEISVSLAEEFLTVPIEDRPGLLQQAIEERWDVVRVRQAVRAPLLELELPPSRVGDATTAFEPASASASGDVVDGSFRELEPQPAAVRTERNRSSSPAQDTSSRRELVKQLHSVRDAIRDLRPYELTASEERALAELFQALLRLARARQQGSKGPVFPALNEAERLARRR
jgi:ParB/RepB/Spo0J family partition protein